MRRAIGLAFLLTQAIWGAGREIAIVMDTSTSMRGTDQPRYAVQVTKILSDLIADEDRMAVARLPVIRGMATFVPEVCSAPAEAGLESVFSASNRAGFKAEIDSRSEYNTEVNAFAAAVHTAKRRLSEDPSKRRMFLFIADSGGLANCEQQLTRELVEMRRGGVFIAAINLGNDKGSFETNPGIELTTLARDSEGLVRAVAEVYQRFLGAKNVQTGSVRQTAQVRIDPFVKEAFLVVASDGAIPTLEQGQGNPRAAGVDLNYRGGGSTVGLDQRNRSYRIVRLKDPEPGTWTFTAPDLNGGFMLLQDYSVGVRLTTSSAPAGGSVTTEWEVYDERTGKRITDPGVLSGMQVEVTANGRTSQAAVSPDGTLRVTQSFSTVGRNTVTGRVTSASLDRAFTSEINVVEPGFRLKLDTPAKADVARTQRIQVSAETNAPGVPGLKPPQQVTVAFSDGTSITLRAIGSGQYSGEWTPPRSGTLTARFTGTGGAKCEPLDVRMEVLGRIEIGTATPVRIGPVKSRSVKESALDLSAAKVYGDVKLNASTDFTERRADLEIELASGWAPLEGAALSVGESGPKKWRVRLRTGECPGECSFSEARQISLAVPKADGSTERLLVPLQVEIEGDPFVVCWWRQIAAALAALAIAFIVYGYIYPHRFPARAGLQISPEENLAEGFFYPLKAQPGSRAGFYRHARVFVTEDYRITGKAAGAFARLRADRSTLQIKPENGRSVWKQRFDGEWEALPAEEVVVRTGTVYRNDDRTVFFEVRMK